MKKHFLILILFVFAMAGMGFAQITPGSGKIEKKKSDLTAKVPIDKKVRMGKLDNGITYYLRANKKPEGRIQFRLAVNAGSVMEDDDQQGLAHFTEHMAFNGTEYYPHNELISKLQAKGVQFGGHVNAWTSFDETVYYVNMPNDDEMIEMGMKILDGWASKLLMDPEEIEAERGVIREEWRGRLGAQDRLQKQYWPVMLQGSRYADRIPIGLESVIMNFQRPVIMRFYEDWYRPDLQAVIIVGDFDVDKMEAKVREYFNDNKMPANPKPRPDYEVPGNKEPLVAIATDPEASSASIQMIWKHAKAPQGTVVDYRQALVRNLATMMINSRFEDLTEKASAPFLGAGGGYGGFIGRHTDGFFLSAYPKDNRIDDATALLLKEMKRVDEHGFLQSELERAKESLLEGYRKSAKELNKTQSNSFAQEYTNHFLDGEVIPGIRQEDAYAREFVPGITLEEVNNVVKDWITDENFIYILTAPQKDGYKVPAKADIMKIVADNKNVQTEPWVDNFKEEELFTKQVKNVIPVVLSQNSVMDYTEYVLPNGIRFVVKKTTYKDDEIQIRSFSRTGGTSLYSDKEAFMASQTAGLVDDAGIANFSSTQLSKKLKGKTLSISPVIAGTYQGFNGTCSPKDLETVLQLIDLYYEAPRKDKESFDRNIEALRTQSRMAEANPQYKFLKDFYGKAYSNNPRMIILPSDKDIDGIDFDRVYSIYGERFNDASDQIFVFVGNVSDENIQTIANYLSILPTNGSQKNEKKIDRSPKMAYGITHSLTLAGTDKQGMVIIQGEKKGFKGDMYDRVVVNALAEALQIRTTEVIREKMGETYSPYATCSYDIDFDGEVSWMFYLQCAPENCESVEQAAIGLIKECIKKGCDKETLTKVKLQLIKERETRMQENSFWMGQIVGAFMYGENRDAAIADYEAMVNAITVSDIKRIARTYFDLKHYAVGTLKPEN